MAGMGDVRVEESLHVKIAEAKNLVTPSVGNGGRNTFCTVKLDGEQIYQTSIAEKSLNPFYGEEFRGEIPRKFRHLSFYVYEHGTKNNKVIGKVSLRKQELYKYHGKDHWFPLIPVDSDTEVQGKVHLEIRFGEFLSTEPESLTSYRMIVKVVESSDLTVTNGACNPYAVVTLSYGKSRHKHEVKRTTVKKKTICPQFDETFWFSLENRAHQHDRNNYYIEDMFDAELSVSLWHDDTRVSREVLGGMFPGVFLGEMKISLTDLTSDGVHNAWYFLRARDNWKNQKQELGSIRLRISYTSDYVFPSEYYDHLRNVLLASSDTEPITSSAAYIFGDIVNNKQDAAQPLVRLFLHQGRLVPLISALARLEISKTVDPNTIFRGNTLVTKLIDELMKLVGLPYLKDTLKPAIDEICTTHVSCEIDVSRLKEGENLEDNMNQLKHYISLIFEAITCSGLVCPTPMCEVFHTLKQVAQQFFPGNNEVRYQVVSGFIFLRFFAAAILGPKLFDLRSDTQDEASHRTLTLVSKAIQGLGNLVSTKSSSLGLKEDYMVPVFVYMSDASHVDAVRMFLDIISSSARTNSIGGEIEAPIILKEGMMRKRAQGRKKFGVKNFKYRHFRLTNQSLSYSKTPDEDNLCVIPIEDILAVERLQEESFKMKYMFQVVQPLRVLYVQADNCVDEKQWLDILNKVCNTNRGRLKTYHPAAYMNGHWLCCKSMESGASGCIPVTGGLPITDIQVSIDIERELEKIHSLLLNNIEKLEQMQDACATQEVYAGEESLDYPKIEDTKTCFETLSKILRCVISLEQEHMQYRKLVQRETVLGSIDTPIGDDSLVFPSDTKL
ncbi:hypothetical protein ScPMuIL_018827 [Solemya velum]